MGLNVRRFVLGFCALSLSACSPGFFARSGDGAPGSPPPGVNPGGIEAPRASCDDVVTQSKIDKFMQQPLAMQLAAIRGENPIPCTGLDSVSGTAAALQGFTSLVVTPATKVTRQNLITDDGQGGFRVDFQLQLAPLADDQLVAIAEAFKNRKGDKPQVAIDLPRFQNVTLANLPAMQQQVVQEGEIFLRVTVPAALAAASREKVGGFAAGTETMTIFVSPDFLNGSIRALTLHADETIQLNGFVPQKAGDYLADLYSRMRDHQGSFQDRLIPFMWMDEARSWWVPMKYAKGEARRVYPDAWTLANSLWSNAGPATDAVGPESSLKALRFLMVVDKQNKLSAHYGSKLQKIETALKLDDPSLYAAVLDIGLRNQYSAEQETTLLEFATKIAPYLASPTQAWVEALAIAQRVNFESRQMSGIVAAADWLRTNQGAVGIDQAKSWVLDQGIDAGRVDQLKNFDSFLAKYVEPTVAHERALDFVINRRLPREQTDVYRDTVDVFSLSLGPEAAFAKAEEYLFQRQLSAQQIAAIISTAKWLQGTSIKAQAIQRAEDYIIVRALPPQDVIRIQKIWLWLQNTSRNLEALTKAEDWVITRKLTDDQTSTIKRAYDWLAYTPSGGTAFEKAEDYVLNRGVSMDQVEQMAEVDSWLRNSPVGTGSVARAEDYVINRHVSREQTNVLEVAYLWLRQTSAKGAALERAEDYVFARGLTPEMFTRLRTLHDKYKTEGDPDPLARAENEVFVAPAPPPEPEPWPSWPL